MSVLQAAGLVLAGVGGGLSGSIAGLASLVTYPALLAAGLGPISANATNTVSLVFNAVGSTSASRPELVGQSPRLRRLVPVAAVAGLVGAGLALVTPTGVFSRIVPWLILLASVAIVRRRPESPPATVGSGAVDGAVRSGPIPEGRWLPLWVAGIGVYGGYFGAAAGVLMLALLLAVTAETLARTNAVKNVVLGAANLSGALLFIAFGPVRWSAALPLAVGCLIGSRIGPAVVRRVPAYPLRLAIGALGVGLAAVLGARAY